MLWCQLEAVKLKPWRHCAANERPRTERFSRLPMLRWNDDLWSLTGPNVCAELKRFRAFPVRRRQR